MPFEKGKPKTGGREKGVVNKTTAETRELFNQVWADNVPKISEALLLVYREDPAKYLEILAKFAQYFVPKKVEQDVEIKDSTIMITRKVITKKND